MGNIGFEPRRESRLEIHFGSYGHVDAFKSTISDEITKGRSAQRALGKAAFRSCNKEVPARKHDKEVPER